MEFHEGSWMIADFMFDEVKALINDNRFQSNQAVSYASTLQRCFRCLEESNTSVTHVSSLKGFREEQLMLCLTSAPIHIVLLTEIDDILRSVWERLHTGGSTDETLEFRDIYLKTVVVRLLLGLPPVLKESFAPTANVKTIEDLSSDLDTMYRCADSALLVCDPSAPEYIFIQMTLYEALPHAAESVPCVSPATVGQIYSAWSSLTGHHSEAPSSGGVWDGLLPCTSIPALPPTVGVENVSVSWEEFVRKGLLPMRPVKIEGGVKGWDAISKWARPGFWMGGSIGRRHAPVECSLNYQSGGDICMMPIWKVLVEGCILKQAPLYMAQHDLVEHVPELGPDCPTPLHVEMAAKGKVQRAVWIGPGGTFSPFHIDPDDNIFCQVVGWKVFELAEPSEQKPSAENGVGVLKVCVGPGDMLFIPKGWWHSVRALSPLAVSVSFWF